MSGSAQLVEAFFPASTGLLRQAAPWLWTRVFPPEGALICPVPEVHFELPGGSTIDLRWPSLAAAAICGAVIGFGCSIQLLLSSKRQARKGDFYWANAFAFFGLMNVFAIVHHCLTPSGFSYYGDVLATWCSSTALVLGFLSRLDCADDSSPRSKALYYALCMLAYSASQVSKPLEFHYTPDILYTAPTILAGALATLVLVRPGAKGEKPCLAGVVGSGVLGLLSVPLDRVLCSLRGGNWLAPVWVFGACDVAFLFLWFYVETLQPRAKVKRQ